MKTKGRTKMQEILDQVKNTILAQAGYAAFLFSIVIGVSLVVKFLLAKSLQKTYSAGAGFISTISQLVVIVVGSYIVAIACGVDPTIILAIVAILTAGISLSADASFKDILAGFKIVTSSRMKPGEWITIGDIHGVITEIGMSSTVIESPRVGLVTMSNHAVTEGMLINHSRLKNLELTIPIPLYDTHDRMKAYEIIFKTLGKIQGWHGGPIVTHTWNGSGEQYEIVVNADKFEERREISSRISLMVTGALEQEKFPIGYATFTHAI